MNQAIDPAVLVKEIEAEAFRLGFCLFGITSIDTPEHYPIYEHWLTDGLNAGMHYMETAYHRTCREQPRQLLPGAKSMLILGWPYPLTRQSPGGRSGWIAGYATEPDYHQRLFPIMRTLVEFIEHASSEPVESKCFTDSAPILEREMGQRAGLGWIAKNSCLISPMVGSNFLLSEIMLSLELPTSEPFTADRCGTCRRCIDACPTHCIRDDRTLDSAKCISYLTIENKGQVPVELRESVGQWVFGCDICQSVCPWNNRSGHTEQNLAPNAALEPEEMILDLSLTPEEFKAKFKESPILRARLFGYLRNIVTVLANIKEVSALDALTNLTKSETIKALHETINWAIVKIKDSSPST